MFMYITTKQNRSYKYQKHTQIPVFDFFLYFAPFIFDESLKA